MRRKAGTLVPLEREICAAAQRLGREFHGFELARVIADGRAQKQLTAYGTLYRALGRLEDMQLLSSRWEDPAIAAEERRPVRRMYRITALGEQALASAREQEHAGSRRTRKWATA